MVLGEDRSISSLAHRTRRRIRDVDVNLLLSSHAQHDRCWEVGIYLDSMLYFDFGKHLFEKTKRGPRGRGATHISIYDCEWRICVDKEIVASNISIDDEVIQEVKESFLGSTIQYFERRSRQGVFLLHFDMSLSIEIDITNASKTDSTIVELTLQNQDRIEFSPRGHIFLDHDDGLFY